MTWTLDPRKFITILSLYLAKVKETRLRLFETTTKMFSRISSVPKLLSTRLLSYAIKPLVSEQNRLAVMSKKSYKLIYFRARGRGEFIRLVFLIAGVEFEDHLVDFQQNWPSLKASKPMPIIFFVQFLRTWGAYAVKIRFSARGACLLWFLQEGYG